MSFTTGSRTAELTPSSSINICPGEDISIKCTDLGTTRTLRWTITPQNRSIDDIQLDLSTLNKTQKSQLNVTFYAEWTSFSPVCSTFTTTAVSALNGAMVTCQQTAASMDMLTITIKRGKPL